ncbi:hypothetical protein D9M70_650810 [compost metagenome]
MQCGVKRIPAADSDQCHRIDGIGDGTGPDLDAGATQGACEEDDVVGKPAVAFPKRRDNSTVPVRLPLLHGQPAASSSALTSASSLRPSAPSILAMSS